jgi:transcriptional regulator of arginine metabolism
VVSAAAASKPCIVIQVEGRRLTKAQRQRLITSVIGRKRVGSQHELLAALAASGCVVTQATVSRDLRELGVEKTRDDLGRPRYLVPETRRGDPREALRRVLSEFGRRIVAAQNIVVVQSEMGSAPAIARALDRVDHPLIVGTLAGDDTCLVVANDSGDARTLAGELQRELR